MPSFFFLRMKLILAVMAKSFSSQTYAFYKRDFTLARDINSGAIFSSLPANAIVKGSSMYTI